MNPTLTAACDPNQPLGVYIDCRLVPIGLRAPVIPVLALPRDYLRVIE